MNLIEQNSLVKNLYATEQGMVNPLPAAIAPSPSPFRRVAAVASPRKSGACEDGGSGGTTLLLFLNRNTLIECCSLKKTLDFCFTIFEVQF